MEFKDRLRELRIREVLTQQELADKTGFSLSVVNKWENGKLKPSLQAVVTLSKFFNESMEYILGLEELK